MEQAAPAAQPAVAEGPAAAELTQAAMPRPPSVDVAQAAQAALAALRAPGEAPEAERLLALCSKLAQVGVWCMCPFVWFSNLTACMLPLVTACVLLPPWSHLHTGRCIPWLLRVRGTCQILNIQYKFSHDSVHLLEHSY